MQEKASVYHCKVLCSYVYVTYFLVSSRIGFYRRKEGICNFMVRLRILRFMGYAFVIIQFLTYFGFICCDSLWRLLRNILVNYECVWTVRTKIFGELRKIFGVSYVLFCLGYANIGQRCTIGFFLGI